MFDLNKKINSNKFNRKNKGFDSYISNNILACILKQS